MKMEAPAYWNAELETQPWPEVERWQAQQIAPMLPALRQRSGLYARLHHDLPEQAALRGLADLAALPFTLKDDLRAAQQAASAEQPFGDNQGVPSSDIVQAIASSGTTGDPLYYALTARDVDRVVRRDRQRVVHRRHPARRPGGAPGRAADGRRRPALCRWLSAPRRHAVLARRLSDRAHPARHAPPARQRAAGDDLVRALPRRALGRCRTRRPACRRRCARCSAAASPASASRRSARASSAA